jgi:hypothetical protein
MMPSSGLSPAPPSSAPPASNPQVKTISLITDKIMSPARERKQVFVAVGDGHVYSVLLDSGATASFIDATVASALKIPITPPPAGAAPLRLAVSVDRSPPRAGSIVIPKVEFLFPASEHRAFAIENYRFEIGALRERDDDPHFILGSDLIPCLFPDRKLPEEYMKEPAVREHIAVGGDPDTAGQGTPSSPSVKSL